MSTTQSAATEAAWAKYSQRINYQFPAGAGSYSEQVTAPVMALIGFRLAVMEIFQQAYTCELVAGPPVAYPCSLADLVLFADCAAELDDYKNIAAIEPAERARIAAMVERLHDAVERIAAMVERLHDAVERIAGQEAETVYKTDEAAAA